jgi:cell division protein FtsB
MFGESRSASWPAIILLALLALMVVRPMIMSVLSYHRTDGLLTERRNEVAKLRSRNEKLSARRSYYKTDAFIAERGRQYGLVMPGETSYVIRELARPESAGTYAQATLANATVDADVAAPKN